MPRSARICAEPGCPTIVTDGSRCTAHQRTAPAKASRHERGYGNDWMRKSRAVLERDRYICSYCGRPATTADHIIPKKRGGTDDLSNLVAACLRCNGSKGARPSPRG